MVKKWILVWIIFCFVLVGMPKVMGIFIPKVIYKEVPIYRVKKEIQYIEKEVFKGERIIEKEVVKYTPLQEHIFEITKVSDSEYTVEVKTSAWGNQAEVTISNNKLHFKPVRQYPIGGSTSVSASSVGFFNRF